MQMYSAVQIYFEAAAVTAGRCDAIYTFADIDSASNAVVMRPRLAYTSLHCTAPHYKV